MRRWIPGFLLLAFLSCAEKNDLPSGVVGKEKMQQIVWDMIQADQYYKEYVEKDSLKKDVKKERYALYDEVFKMHKVDRATFDKSFEYYSAHPKLMKEVFDSMSVQGNRNLQNIYKTPSPVDTSTLNKIKPRLDSMKARRVI